MELVLAQEMAEQLAKNAGLQAPICIQDIEQLGVCVFANVKDVDRIVLQRSFVLNSNAYIIADVVLHEVAHGLLGARNPPHDSVWEKKYLELGGMGVGVADTIMFPDANMWAASCNYCGEKNFGDDDVTLVDPAELELLCVACGKIFIPPLVTRIPKASWCGNDLSPTKLANITASGRNLYQKAMQA